MIAQPLSDSSHRSKNLYETPAIERYFIEVKAKACSSMNCYIDILGKALISIHGSVFLLSPSLFSDTTGFFQTQWNHRLSLDIAQDLAAQSASFKKIDRRSYL